MAHIRMCTIIYVLLCHLIIIGAVTTLYPIKVYTYALQNNIYELRKNCAYWSIRNMYEARNIIREIFEHIWGKFLTQNKDKSSATRSNTLRN